MSGQLVPGPTWGQTAVADPKADKKAKKREKKMKKKKKEAKRRRMEGDEGQLTMFKPDEAGNQGTLSIRAVTKRGGTKQMFASAATQHLVAVQGQGPRWGGTTLPDEKTALGKAISASAQSFNCGACGFLFRAYWGSSVDCPQCGGIIDIPYTREQAQEVQAHTTAGCEKKKGNSTPWSILGGAGGGGGGDKLAITGGAGGGRGGLAITDGKEVGKAGALTVGGAGQIDAKTGLPAAGASGMVASTGEDMVQTVAGHPWVLAMRYSPVNFGQRDLEERHIILMMGQSNMVGRDKHPPVEMRQPLDGPCWHVDENGRFHKGCAEPMCPHDGRSFGVGPGRSFSERIHELLGEQHGVVLVPCAVGATGIPQWQRGQMLYSVAASRARSIAQACGGRIAGVLWHQGEDDGCAKVTADRYHDLMLQLITDLRNDLGAGLPVVMGQLGPFLDEESLMPVHRHADVINLAIRNLGQHPGNACVPGSEHCMADRLHFNAQGMHEMGRRYAEAWAQLWCKKELGEKRYGPDKKAYSKEQWARKFGDLKHWAFAETAPQWEAGDSDSEDSDDSDSSLSMADAGRRVGMSKAAEQSIKTQTKLANMPALDTLFDATPGQGVPGTAGSGGGGLSGALGALDALENSLGFSDGRKMGGLQPAAQITAQPVQPIRAGSQGGGTMVLRASSKPPMIDSDSDSSSGPGAMA